MGLGDGFQVANSLVGYATEAAKDQMVPPTTFRSFTATDIYATVLLSDSTEFHLGNLSLISVSTHRDSFPVGAMGYVAPRGFTKGHRTVAGSLVFSGIDRNAFYELGRIWSPGYTLYDTLPPFDVLIVYVNEMGDAAYERIEGIEILDYSRTVSLENLIPYESYSYSAINYHPVQPATQPNNSQFTLNRSTRQPLRFVSGSTK